MIILMNCYDVFMYGIMFNMNSLMKCLNTSIMCSWRSGRVSVWCMLWRGLSVATCSAQSLSCISLNKICLNQSADKTCSQLAEYHHSKLYRCTKLLVHADLWKCILYNHTILLQWKAIWACIWIMCPLSSMKSLLHLQSSFHPSWAPWHYKH